MKEKLNFFNYLIRRTVSRDLLFGLTITIVFVSSASGTIYFMYSSHNMNRELDAKCEKISNELTELLQLPVWDLNVEFIEKIVSSYMKSEYLIGIVLKSDNKIIINIKPQGKTKTIRKDRAISIKGFDVGSLELYYSGRIVEDALQSVAFAIIIVIVAVIISLVIGTYFVMYAFLNKPFEQLTRGIRNIQTGNYDNPLPSAKQQDINEIILEVNLMAAIISRREKELRQLNKDLQVRIKIQEETEKALAESEKKYRSIFENAVEGIMQTNVNGQIMGANPTMATLLGYDSVSELIESVSDLGKQIYVNPDRRKELLKIFEKEERVTGFECQYYRKNKEIIWVSLRLRAAIRDDSGNIVQLEGFVADITERKRIEQELKKYRAHLEELVRERTGELIQTNKALEESMNTLKKTQDHLVHSKKMAALGGLVAGVAHEINTPVGIGVTAASFLERKTRETEVLLKNANLKRSDLEKYMTIAVESTTSILANLSRAAELIQSFKKIAVDQSVEEKVRFQLKDYMDNILLSLRPKYKRTRHSVISECPEKLMIESYPGAFMQIITNLVINSLNHGFENMEEGQIMIRVSEEQDHIIINYSDNGEGMRQDQMEHLYDPFYTTKRGQGGTGLGMNIVYNLVTRTLGGEIECKSEYKKGTNFNMRIPKMR